MKLRNKKTGKILTLDSDHSSSLADFGGKILIEFDDKECPYDTLADLCNDWEDYKPTEPLIKDEKIRKAVRAWAEAVGTDSAFVEKWAYDGDQFVLSDELAEIHFRITTPKEIKTYKRYTIAELCGEEE